MTPEAAARARLAAGQPRTATPADTQAVAKILADAFADDPFNRWFLRADTGYADALLRMYLYLASEDIPAGRVFLTGDGLAAAQWQPPGPPQPAMTWWQKLALAPLIMRNTGVARAGRLLRLISFMEAHHPREPHHYLFLLGVTRAAQGNGLGSALLESTLAQVDADGLPAYLENSNPKNTRLYERHGFAVTKEASPAPGAPVMQFMWRGAR